MRSSTSLRSLCRNEFPRSYTWITSSGCGARGPAARARRGLRVRVVCISSSAEEGGGGAAGFGAPSPATGPCLDRGIGRRWCDDRGIRGFEEAQDFSHCQS